MVYMINLCKIIFSLFPSPWLSKNKNSPVYDYPYPGSGLPFLQLINPFKSSAAFPGNKATIIKLSFHCYFSTTLKPFLYDFRI